MDALSTRVSSLRAAGSGFLSAHARVDPHLLNPPSIHHRTTKTKILPSSPLSHQPLDRPRPVRLPPPRSHKPASANANVPVHNRASTGYAAALLDATQCDQTLAAVERDVRRLKRVFSAVMAVPSVDEARKGEIVREAADCGGFDRRLVALVRMLVGKQMVGMVGEVIEEFGRFCDELSGTEVVLVSSVRRMQEGELAGIARKVRRSSAAARVKVQHLFRESSPSYAA